MQSFLFPSELKKEYPLSPEILNIKEKRDREIRSIFTGESDKFIVIVGAMLRGQRRCGMRVCKPAGRNK